MRSVMLGPDTLIVVPAGPIGASQVHNPSNGSDRSSGKNGSPGRCKLTDDRTVDATGTVGNRQVFHFADGQALAKATLVPEDGGKPVPVVWWEPGRAPPDGARVRVKGRIREFGGETELHADETTVERAGTANGPLAAIAAFYLACVEAEAASSLRLRPGGKGHIVLREGANPLHETLHFTETSPHYGWFQARQAEAAVGETLLSGWQSVGLWGRLPIMNDLAVVYRRYGRGWMSRRGRG